ncbi:YL1 nuclear C-terminal [Penicillium waksmanii]|uniref:YL1 nuclear C-terminal n=1 Tax=Penicillium waksmanii TaxID=69791 RepID=UPI0025494295|nr:YL1 nuclear C-terminal [Penicillium waksmanii]KAJ5988145.1 YL1 nuclear C-terminal [Penicillium waksmanii]
MTDMLEEDPSSGLVSSSEEEEETEDQNEQIIESLVSGRAKRSTAGQHMSALIDAAADDDLTLLFEEVEDDNEFAMDVEAAEEDDLGLESDDDDDDDQGPNANNDYEGEKQLQKDERKKRRAQNDLRFQTLRKRVKIDPMAVSTPSALPPPRPKKKSERISWIPTVEDGPVRSSSRRQTMVNKEITHARLKDSQEKRIRIIATMKEAEKRKAHLKPKEMTQEDHLAEAARIERLNSKSVNRWEKTERRKAEERRARIEALQNRRLEGPVMSYWSGLATWVNGRLTRVGKVDIKAKPEKEEKKKTKKEKEEKPPVESQAGQSATTQPAPTTTQPEGVPTTASSTSLTQPAQPASAATTQSGNPSALAQPPAEVPAQAAGENVNATTQPENTSAPATAAEPISTLSPQEPPKDRQSPEMNANSEESRSDQPVADTSDKVIEPTEPESTEATPKSPEKQPVSDVKSHASRASSSPSKVSQTAPPADSNEVQAMDIDQPVTPADAPKAEAPSQEQANVPVAGSDTQVASGDVPQSSTETTATEPLSDHVTDAASTNPPLDSKAPLASSPDAAPLHATPPVVPVMQGDPNHQSQGESPAVIEGSAPPEHPPAPPVIEYTGRNLTILENFDDRTAHSKKFSMYFNAKKPPRLTKISSSLCVITSLPSRYRDPETSLPYANSYAYGQIRKMLSHGYIWSSMLGCFVGAAETAARGVPERFVGKPISGVTVKQEEVKDQDKEKEKEKNTETASKEETTSSKPDSAKSAGASAAEPMAVDA